MEERWLVVFLVGRTIRCWRWSFFWSVGLFGLGCCLTAVFGGFELTGTWGRLSRVGELCLCVEKLTVMGMMKSVDLAVWLSARRNSARTWALRIYLILILSSSLPPSTFKTAAKGESESKSKCSPPLHFCCFCGVQCICNRKKRIWIRVAARLTQTEIHTNRAQQQWKCTQKTRREKVVHPSQRRHRTKKLAVFNDLFTDIDSQIHMPAQKLNRYSLFIAKS